MPSRYVIEEDLYDIDAYHDAVYEEMAIRGGPVPEAYGGHGGADEEDEEEEEWEEDEEDEEDEDEEDEGEEEEEPEPVQLVAGDSGTPLRVRVSGAAAAAGAGAGAGAIVERSNASTCPVCMDPWTSQGPHRMSCIPCGHVYGRSCLEKWLAQRRNQSATCPQCGKRFKHKDIINLYAQEDAIPNIELEKEISCLKEEISSLKKKVMRHDKMFEEMIKLQRQNDGGSSKRQKVAERSYEGANLEPSTPAINFSLQNELPVDGARVISIDASKKLILVSGRATTAIGAEYVLTKIDMLANLEVRKIHLPPDTKAIKDICILPGGSAIFTSLGRRLSLFSMTNDNIVLKWDLPAPGWSCAVDASGQHIYAGLQNGMVLVFDIRQTSGPLHSMAGLSAHPVHTLHSVLDNNGSSTVLSASAVGPCMWDADNNQSRPHLLTRMGDERVCISLACAAPSSDLLVASFRPKVDPTGDGDAAAASQVYPSQASQVYLSQTPTRSGSGKLGYHTLIRRTDIMGFSEGPTWHNAKVSECRMSKSAIIPYGDNRKVCLFAYGDESLCGVRTWQLPSLQMHADLGSHREPILDLRYAKTEGPSGGRYLGCLSEEKLQVFRVS